MNQADIWKEFEQILAEAPSEYFEEFCTQKNHALFLAAGQDVFMRENCGNWFVFLNDTWYWGTGDDEEIPKDEEGMVASLFRDYGRMGVLWWVWKRREHLPQFSPEKEGIMMIDELISLEKKLREAKVYTKEKLCNTE